jgi:HNH endonuclease
LFAIGVSALRHAELPEAAHILPDGHPEGRPIVPNGLWLCALHHAAFDGNVLEVRPDLKVEIRLDALEEEDGRCCSIACSGSTGCTRPESGVVTLLDTLCNPRGETVLTQKVTLLVSRRGRAD